MSDPARRDRPPTDVGLSLTGLSLAGLSLAGLSLAGLGLARRSAGAALTGVDLAQGDEPVEQQQGHERLGVRQGAVGGQRTASRQGTCWRRQSLVQVGARGHRWV